MTDAEMQRLGWSELDVLLISGDAYVDHPSFAVALLGRCLVAHGFRTGIIAQPDWENLESLLAMGRPRLFAGISGGNVDSMLAHYTAFRKKRSDDAYTPGNVAGKRPNRAVIVYSNLARRAFPGLPVIIGGIEASLRRITHYDFWSNALRRSILLDSKADLLAYGMGERAIVQAAQRLRAGESLAGIPGTAFAGNMADLPGLAARTAEEMAEDAVDSPIPARALLLPSHAAHLADRDSLMTAALQLERHVHQRPGENIWACQPLEGDVPVGDAPVGDALALNNWPYAGRAVLIAPPAPLLSGEELDALHGLPFARRAHPSYKEAIPAEAMISASITTHRGCGGGCAFCSLALHQGRRIASRGRESILAEAQLLASRPSGGGVISDLGGPSANMWNTACGLPENRVCRRASCLHPEICAYFVADQAACVDLLRSVAGLPGVRHVRVASGVRFDLAFKDADAVAAYTREFTGGQLKIAPEHISDTVLNLMRKPQRRVFERFVQAFQKESARAGKEQYVVPYLISAHPGCTDAHMRELADWLRARNWSPRQVQCFIPTPGTVATAMYYTGKDPQGRPIHVAMTDAERMRQHALLAGQWGKAGRESTTDRPGRPGQMGKSGQTGRPGKPGQAAKPGKPDRPARPDKTARPDQKNKPGKAGKASYGGESGKGRKSATRK